MEKMILFTNLFTSIVIVEAIVWGVLMMIGYLAGNWITKKERRVKIFSTILIVWSVLLTITIVIFIIQNEKMLGELLA